MFIHSHLSSSLLCKVAFSTVRMLLLEYALATATMAFSFKWIITGNAMNTFFKKMERTKEIYKYGSTAEILTLLISTFSPKYMVVFIKN